MIAVFPQLRGESQPALSRQLTVKQRDRDCRKLRHLSQRLLRIRDFHRHHAPLLDLLRKRPTADRSVFHDQHTLSREHWRKRKPGHESLHTTLGQRQGEVKRRANTFRALNPHPAAHEFDEAFADGEAQSGATILPRDRTVRLAERAKEAPHRFSGNTDPGIADCDMKLARLGDLAVGWRRLTCDDVD